LYLFGEGVCGIKNRVKAWHKYYDIEPNSNFICVPMISNLKNEIECYQFISNCKTLEKKFGDNIALVIVDTLARSSLGIDENSAQEMGMIIHSFDKIKNELDTTVMIIHHSKKGGGGIRGSGSILGAVDTSMKVSKKKDSDIVTIETEKQKDGPDFNMTFKLEDSLESKVIVSTGTGNIAENELKVDNQGKKWDEEQYTLLLELVKCKDVYEIAPQTNFFDTWDFVLVINGKVASTVIYNDNTTDNLKSSFYLKKHFVYFDPIIYKEMMSDNDVSEELSIQFYMFKKKLCITDKTDRELILEMKKEIRNKQLQLDIISSKLFGNKPQLKINKFIFI
jgi:hypothetical protein